LTKGGKRDSLKLFGDKTIVKKKTRRVVPKTSERNCPHEGWTIPHWPSSRVGLHFGKNGSKRKIVRGNFLTWGSALTAKKGFGPDWWMARGLSSGKGDVDNHTTDNKQER